MTRGQVQCHIVLGSFILLRKHVTLDPSPGHQEHVTSDPSPGRMAYHMLFLCLDLVADFVLFVALLVLPALDYAAGYGFAVFLSGAGKQDEEAS